MKPWLAYLVAVGSALLAIIIVSTVWVGFLRTGPKLDAWVAGPIIVAVPVALVALTAMWLLLRAGLARWVTWNVGRVLAASLVLAYILTAITCGPVACFQALPSFWVGWFLLLGTAIAACVHHAIFRHLLRKANKTAS